MSGSLRRRFEQNQEDCTFTVLALLPTATANILAAMETEKITLEIQQTKSGAARSAVSGSGSLSPPSIGDTNLTEDDGRSLVSTQSESGVHVSQVVASGPSDPSKDGGQATPQKKKTKRQLWHDLTISCRLLAPLPLHSLSTRGLRRAEADVRAIKLYREPIRWSTLWASSPCSHACN